MFSFIGTWPLWAQIGISLILVSAIIYVSMRGNMVVQWGKTKLGIGGAANLKKNRTCGDCILILFGKGKKHEVDVNQVEKGILKDQMNFAEQKLLETDVEITRAYRKELYHETDNDVEEKNKQFILFKENLKNALAAIKDELRRSFKENGFHDLRGTDYSLYVKNQAQTLASIGKQYVSNHYPPSRMLIELDEKIDQLDNAKTEDMAFEIYNRAKEIRLEADLKIGNLNNQFKEEIDQYVGDK